MNNKQVDTLALKRLKVKSEDSQEVPFVDLYKDGKVTFIFIRHFGCIACRGHVSQVMEQLRAGARKGSVIFIGNGHPTLIKAFKQDMKVLDAQIFTDPSLEVFDACGLNRGLTYLLSTSTVRGFYKLKKQGFSQGKQQKENGYHRQMGGVIVMSKTGQVLYHYASHYLGDIPNDDQSV